MIWIRIVSTILIVAVPIFVFESNLNYVIVRSFYRHLRDPKCGNNHGNSIFDLQRWVG